MPKRIQRKRIKGWKMPINTVSATRPGKWGNPFKVGQFAKIGNGKCAGEFSYLICVEAKYDDGTFTEIKSVEQCLELYAELMKRYPRKDIAELRGKDIACFCALDKPCHVDILLKIANQ